MAERNTANAPATCGAAMEVPDMVTSSVFAEDDAATMRVPGAIRSSVVAKLEKLATLVPLSVAPTATALEMQAGFSIIPVAPSFPADTTTATPFLRNMSMTALRGSSSQ